MSWNSKVVWSEGMFLRPQHFQQQDRYMEAFVRGRCGSLRPYDWGINLVELDEETLALGKLAIRTCQGILPDGTPFKIPHDDDPPRPLEIDANLRDAKVLLALPLRRVGMAEVGRELGDETVARYQVRVCEVQDDNLGVESSAPLEIGKPRLRLILDQGLQQADYATIGVARIIEKRSDQTLVLDKQYLPPCLDCRAVPGLAGFITEILGLLHQRGEALAGRVSESGRGGVAEIADFLLLQMVNRFEPLFAHLDIMTGLHPESFYQIVLQLAGELATFVTESKRPASFPPYRHDDLQNTFAPVRQELRQLLSMVLEQNAILLPLQERKLGSGYHPLAIATCSLKPALYWQSVPTSPRKPCAAASRPRSRWGRWNGSLNWSTRRYPASCCGHCRWRPGKSPIVPVPLILNWSAAVTTGKRCKIPPVLPFISEGSFRVSKWLSGLSRGRPR